MENIIELLKGVDIPEKIIEKFTNNEYKHPYEGHIELLIEQLKSLYKDPIEFKFQIKSRKELLIYYIEKQIEEILKKD